jgi:hypothetical protein
MLAVYRSYLAELLVRFRIALGGGSLLLIGAGIFEHYALHSVSWVVYLWIVVGSCVVALLRHGADQHERLLPKIIVRGPRSHDWNEAHLKGRGYYFDIFNASATVSLKNVRVDLEKIVPDVVQGLLIPMKVKNDDYATREFSINPGATRQIDFVTGPSGIAGCQQAMVLTHTIPTGSVIPNDRYQMTFVISADGVGATRTTFEVWIDASGQIKSVKL